MKWIWFVQPACVVCSFRRRSFTCTVCIARTRRALRRSGTRWATRTPSFWWVLMSPPGGCKSHNVQRDFWTCAQLKWCHIDIMSIEMHKSIDLLCRDFTCFKWIYLYCFAFYIMSSYKHYSVDTCNVFCRNARGDLVINFPWGPTCWSLYRGSPSTSCYWR